MEIFFRRYFLTLHVLLYFIAIAQCNSEDTTITSDREGRVSGRIVKIYSGVKKDPMLCLDEGFRADPLDCAVFYRCIKSSKGKFNVFRFQCAPGTVYDPEIEVCNYPSNTKRSECGGRMQNVVGGDDIEGQELPSPISTVSSIYSSQSESKNTTELSPTTQFAEKYLSYKPVSNVVYPLLSTTERKYQEHSNNYQWIDSQNKVQNAIESYTTFAPNTEKSACTSDGFIGDSNDCRKFYRCVSDSRGGFKRFEFSCSETTVWDDNLQSCNHAWAVRSNRCSRSQNKNSSIDQKYNYISQNKPFDHSSGTKVDEHQNDSDNDIYDENSSGYGNKLSDKLQSNFNSQETSSFETHDKVNNTQEAINNQHFESNKISYHNTTPSSYPINHYQLGSSAQITDNNQSSKCKQSGFMADSDNCQKFYRCVDNGNGGFTKYEFTCSHQTVWDSRIEACNHAWAVPNCAAQQLNEKSSTAIPVSIPTSTSNSFQEDIDSGYVNQFNQEQVQTTSSSILTTVSLLSTTEASKSTSSECSSSGFFRNSYDCQKFYRCVQNDKNSFTRYDYKCGDGTVWDPSIESCNHVWAVNSCNHNTSENTTMSSVSNEGINKPTTVSLLQTTSNEYSHNYDNDSGYNSQPSLSTTTSISDVSNTTLKNPEIQTIECQSSGFMGDRYDCKKFYRCVDSGNEGFVRYEFSCGEGTVWDSEIEACNHAWAVKECGGSMQSTSTVVSIASSQSLDDGEEAGYMSQSNNKPDGFMTTTTLFSSTVASTTTNYECKSDGFIGDQNNCKKFYRCVDNGNGGFTQHEFSCGEGTAWDTSIQACNHEWAVRNCKIQFEAQVDSSSQNQNNSPAVISSPIPDTQIQETQTPVYLVISTSRPDINNTNSKEDNCQFEGFFANTNDCKKFFRCVNDNKGGYIRYDFSCGDGTIWVQEIQACDHDTDVNCSNDISNTTNAITTTTLVTKTTTVQNEINTSTEKSMTSTIKNEIEVHKPSKDECTLEGFYPNSNDCRNFYRCVDNGDGHYTKYDFSCAEGTAWDDTIGSCNYISRVNRCNNLQTKPIMQDEQVSGTEQEITNTESTTKSTTTMSTSKSTANTETSSISTTTKTTTTKSTTELPTSNNHDCEQDGFYGNTQDCTKFYRCVSDEKGQYTKYDFTCGEGTIWDQDIIACNHPQDVTNPSCKSQQESQSTSTSSTQLTSEDSGNALETTSNPLSSSTSSSNKNDTNTICSNSTVVSTNDDDNNSNITCKKAGFFANPSDCKKFYRCVDWDNSGERFSIFHFECGEGTIWDPALDTCNHADSVYPPRNCNGTNEQPITSSTTTKQPSTENSNTLTSTTTKSTTQLSTTQESTTQQSTTPESTTRQLTTQESTTLQSTTQQSTIQQSTTQQSTTRESTSQQTTAQESTSHQPTTQESTTQQSTTQETTSQQSTTQDVTTQPSTTTDKSTTQQATETTQTTTQTQEQTTKSSTEQTEVTESNTSSTSESSSQTAATESTTQQLTTAESSSQTESSSTEVSSTETSTTEKQTESSTEATANQNCPETEKDQYLLTCPTSFKRHPKYCNMFYQCTDDNDSHEIKVAVFQCPNNTIYDESKIQCVQEDKSDKKCDGEIAKKHRVKRLGIATNDPIQVTNESMICPAVGHFSFEKNEKCSATLLKCGLTKTGKLRGFVYRCPEGYVFWSISKKCEPLKKIHDCNKPSEVWTKRYDIPIESHNVGR